MEKTENDSFGQGRPTGCEAVLYCTVLSCVTVYGKKEGRREGVVVTAVRCGVGVVRAVLWGFVWVSAAFRICGFCVVLCVLFGEYKKTNGPRHILGAI